MKRVKKWFFVCLFFKPKTFMWLLLHQQISPSHYSCALFLPRTECMLAANNRIDTPLCSLKMSLNPQSNRITKYHILKRPLLSKVVFVYFWNTWAANLFAKKDGLKTQSWDLCIKGFRNFGSENLIMQL